MNWQLTCEFLTWALGCMCVVVWWLTEVFIDELDKRWLLVPAILTVLFLIAGTLAFGLS